MSFLFGSSKIPSPKPVSAPVLPTPPVQAAKAEEVLSEEKKKLTQGRTKRTTLLTGPQGVLEPANVSTKTLLGQ